MPAPFTRVRQWLFWFGVLLVVAASMLTQRGRLDKAHVTLAFLLIVLWGSSRGGRAVGIALASGAFLVFNWFFLPPYNTLVIADPLDWLVLLAFLVTGITAAQLLERERRQGALAKQRAEEIDRIATLGAESLNAPRAEDALATMASVIRDRMRTDFCHIFLRQQSTGWRLAGGPQTALGEQEASLLTYTIDNAEAAAERADGTLSLVRDALKPPAGSTDLSGSLSDLRALGIPLRVRDRVVGALRLTSATPFSLSDDQRRVLGALAYYAALGVERVRLTEAEEQTESLRRADRLKDALLASVSHDLRTPLTAIKGIANEVWQGGDPFRAHTIEEEADRMTALVEDLLELSQLNAGSLRVHIALNTADDVIGAALTRVEAAHGVGRIRVQLESEGEILVGAFDFSHTMRALTNLLENAMKYSPDDAQVVLRAWRDVDRVHFSVQDSGTGIPADDAERIFEPFYRGRNRPDGVRGTGLGLSIARQLAEAQHGSITYEPGVGGGSRFTLTVPAMTDPVPDADHCAVPL